MGELSRDTLDPSDDQQQLRARFGFPPTGRDGGRQLERATPVVLGVLGALWLGLTVFLHVDPGRSAAADRPSRVALAGRQQWLRHNCSVCHQLYGLGGFLGPDLTNEYSLRGAGVIESVLLAGYGSMPRIPMEPAEAAAIAAYLEYVDRTGRFPQRKWPLEALPN